tara:strand:- start:2637 stop:3806 length:1170 start_codon:yes stop_codon:yes gene_type:complete
MDSNIHNQDNQNNQNNEKSFYNNDYLTTQIITYMGNKRKILNNINKVLDIIEQRENGRQLTMADGFSGSGIVARLLKTRASKLYVNDSAGYSKTLNQCYLSSPNKSMMKKIKLLIQEANKLADNNKLNQNDKWISKHWAPQGNIKENDRVFFTENNANRIDIIRNFIQKQPIKYQPYLLAPLIVQASIHNNTNGQFTAFYKDGNKGAFGGSKAIDINRITKPIAINIPTILNNDCQVHISQDDTNNWINNIPHVDVLYIDPPYNKHPYSIYYFLLDIINNWDKNIDIPTTYRGQPKNWCKSNYNSLNKAEQTFNDLIKNAKAKYIILSYNDEGIIPLKNIETILNNYGNVEKIPIQHNVYNRLRGIAKYKRQKNEKNVKEFLWILTKKL